MAIDQEVLELQEKTQDLIKKQMVQDLISKNEIEFAVGTTQYRVRRPSYAQKQQVISARTKKFLQLLKERDPITKERVHLKESDLVATYLESGIDIGALDVQISNYQSKRNELNLRIGKMLEENQPEDLIAPFKKELEDVIAKQNQPLMQKSVYMEVSIESQVNVYAYVYMGALITEKAVQSTVQAENVSPESSSTQPSVSWTKAWGSYDDFTKENEDVVNAVVWHTAMVARNEIPSL